MSTCIHCACCYIHLAHHQVKVVMEDDVLFIDRDGSERSFSNALLGDLLHYHSGNESLSQMIFKAEFNGDGDITSISPALLVDQRAMAKPFIGLSFIGNVLNSDPLPAKIKPSYWFRCVCMSCGDPLGHV